MANGEALSLTAPEQELTIKADGGEGVALGRKALEREMERARRLGRALSAELESAKPERRVVKTRGEVADDYMTLEVKASMRLEGGLSGLTVAQLHEWIKGLQVWVSGPEGIQMEFLLGVAMPASGSQEPPEGGGDGA